MSGELLRFPGGHIRDPKIDVWLAREADERHVMAKTWFERMRQCGSDVRELMHDGCPTVCVDDAAFAYVGVYTAHVNVGFFHGASLADPAGLLEGTGKRMRHVKLRPGPEIDRAALEKLIAASYTHIKAQLRKG